ncbi:MAG: HAD hydrolase family protein, partial [Sulfuriferula sp.]
FTFFTERLQGRLGLDYTASNTLEIVAGKLSGRVLGKIVDAQAKADHLNRIRTELGLEPAQVVAMGDGANDLKMMDAAGLSIAYRAKPIVQAQASYALNFSGLDAVIPLLGTL